jgi:hypothetical protein
MKVRVVTREDGEQVFEDISKGRVEFEVGGMDPELPTRFWLSDILSVEVEGHPAPVTQTAPPAEYEWVSVTKGELHYGPAAESMREHDPNIDKEAYRYRRIRQAEPKKKPAKPKAVKK